MSTRITQLVLMDAPLVLTALRLPDTALESIGLTEAMLPDTKYWWPSSPAPASSRHRRS
jgi:hypothetical protein